MLGKSREEMSFQLRAPRAQPGVGLQKPGHSVASERMCFGGFTSAAAGSAEGAARGKRRRRERGMQSFLVHFSHILCVDTGP